MGYLPNNSELTVYAKLTPFGRAQLLKSNTTLITKFSLGDSDANYEIESTLNTGNVPTISGNLAVNNDANNSSPHNYIIRNVVPYLNGRQFKGVELGSTEVTTENVKNGTLGLSDSGVTQEIIDRTVDTEKTNLYKTFNLPITDADKVVFDTTTYNSGGFADTALSGFNQDEVLVIGIPNYYYGEQLDGKAINVSVTTTASTFNIYGTYENLNQSLAGLDKNTSENTVAASKFGNNVAFLFSDDIKKPSGSVSKSWADGFGKTRPFSVNNKELFNIQDKTNTTGDTAVGIAYLDKGFIVITDPTIVGDMDLSTGSTTSSATTVMYDHYSTEVFQSVNVLANRGEFNTSNNNTFEDGDTVRISEIGLYDDGNNLIAIAKPDRHIIKRSNQIISLSIKINV
jgi:hypothetical protein